MTTKKKNTSASAGEELEGRLRKLLAPLEDMATLVRAATPKFLKDCNKELLESDYPQIPDDYAAFLKISDGYAFDSVELYGTHTMEEEDSGFMLIELLTATDDFNEHYVFGEDAMIDSEEALLCIGRQNGDYFTWNPQTGMYEVRSHECITDVWGEYERFEDLFLREVIGYSGQEENDDDGRYDAYV